MERPEMRTVSGAVPGRVALGTMLFGTGIEEEKAFLLLEAHTIRPRAQIDTARSYASWLPEGEGASEMDHREVAGKERQRLQGESFSGDQGMPYAQRL